jgi:hypothetical protein
MGKWTSEVLEYAATLLTAVTGGLAPSHGVWAAVTGVAALACKSAARAIERRETVSVT